MEISQRNQCIAILNKNVFFFLFLQNQRTGRQNRSCLGVGNSGLGEDKMKRYRRGNMMEIFCTYVGKWKNETC
jgi:hypothetical protein